MNAKPGTWIVLGAWLASLSGSSAATGEVETAKYDWFDATRDRQIPVKIFYPKAGGGPFPAVIFSHGLGGTRDGYDYLGNYWASRRYVSVHLQHVGSDESVWKDCTPEDRIQAMRRAAANPQNAINRPLDVSFAIDQMTRMNRGVGPLAGRLDLEHIGVAGHSFGAYTALAVAGEIFVGPFLGGKTYRDPRVKAAISMSSPVPRDKNRLGEMFGDIAIPCLHMTGTRDVSPINDTKPEERRILYDHIHRADQYLIIFKDGDHMIFSGHERLRAGGEKDSRFHELICLSSTSFWDAYLKGDEKAKTWLSQGGFDQALDGQGKFEKKLVK